MRDFGKLWTAGTISSLGDGVTVVAGPLLAAALTRDPVLGRYFGLTAPFWLGAVHVSAVAIATWRVLNDRDIRAARAAARSAVGSGPGTTQHRTHD